MTAPAEGPYRATDDVVVSLTYVRKASRTAQDFADELNKAFAAGEKKEREKWELERGKNPPARFPVDWVPE